MSARKNSEIFDPTAPPPRASTPQSTRLSRLMREAGWIVFLALAIYLALIFATYQQSDPGYFFTVKDGPILNKGGWMGAQLSHFAFGISGLSAWWWVALAVYAVMRLFHRVEVWSMFDHRNLAIALIGFMILLLASSTLEALRLHSLTV
ncbi:MAG: DNA translocase FtsK 4TM domain-containing protein, partial [Betaproteobacteria bacterium]